MNFLNYLYHLSRTSSHIEDFKDDNQKINWSLLPKNIINETDKTKFSSLAKDTFLYFSKGNNKFTYSTQILHPNLIRYFIRNKACDIDIEKDSIFLRSTKDTEVKTEISKQIKFGYEFSSVLRKQKNKRLKAKDKFNPLLEIFDTEDNIKICCEHPITNGKGIENRIDYTLKLKSCQGKTFFLGIEFLEERAHKNQGKIDYNKIQEMRWNRISVSNKNVKHLAFAWESLWNRTDGYKDFFVKKLEFLFDIYDSANNKKEFGIQFLEKFLNSRIISEKLYEAYNNQNNYLLNYNEIVDAFEVTSKQDSLKEYFKKTCDRRYQLKKGLDNEVDISLDDLMIDDSDEEDDVIKSCDDNIFKSYIIDENNNLMINAEGLKIFTEIVKEENFKGITMKKFTLVKDIYHNVANASVHAINKVYDLTTELSFNDTFRSFGLDHRENEPDYEKRIVKKITAQINKKEIQKTKEKINEGEKIKIKVNKSKKNKQQNIVV